MSGESIPKTLVVIPVYNHGATLRDVVSRCLAAGWPVLVVDDGSDDGGPDGLVDLPCRIRRLARNQGKGAAILAGARLAWEWGYDAIVTMDADGQLDPADAHRLVDEAGRVWPALIVGARQMDRDNAPASSLFGRKFSNFWVHLECGQELPDTQSGFRLYPVDYLLRLAVRARRFDFEVEVLVRAAWAGIPIRTVPVSVHYPDGERRNSHFHQGKDNARLTLLHTRLVSRALVPWPHRRLVPRTAAPAEAATLRHPVRLLRRLSREHVSPVHLASAAWLGIFLGALPLLAVHTVVILYVAHRLHLNKIAAVAASQICAPPVVPVLCVEAGHFLRTGRFLVDVSWEVLVVQFPYRLWEWALGSLIVGPVLGVIVGISAYLVARRLQGNRVVGTEAAGLSE